MRGDEPMLSDAREERIADLPKDADSGEAADRDLADADEPTADASAAVEDDERAASKGDEEAVDAAADGEVGRSDDDPETAGVQLAPEPRQPAGDLVTVAYPRSVVAEAYRDLRTSLNFARLDERLRSIVVTSSGPAEGKSTTVANLGVTMALAGSTVLVIDADLRRASLDRQFGLSNQFGLTNALFDPDNLKLYVRSTPVERLSVLTSGPLPPNPSELLGSERMRALLDELRDKYEMVIVDTPPIGSVSDALLLSPRVDGVVLVVHAGGLPREVVQRAKSKLDQAKANVLGVVLNKVDIEREQPYYYYYGYSSAYYLEPGEPSSNGSK